MTDRTLSAIARRALTITTGLLLAITLGCSEQVTGPASAPSQSVSGAGGPSSAPTTTGPSETGSVAGAAQWTAADGTTVLDTELSGNEKSNTGEVTHNLAEGGYWVVNVEQVVVEGNAACLKGEVVQSTSKVVDEDDSHATYVVDRGNPARGQPDKIGGAVGGDCETITDNARGTVTDGNLTVN